jgi:hypothetical protein
MTPARWKGIVLRTLLGLSFALLVLSCALAAFVLLRQRAQRPPVEERPRVETDAPVPHEPEEEGFLAGRVTRDGRPAAAEVTAVLRLDGDAAERTYESYLAPRNDGPARTVEVGEDGAFRFGGLAPGAYALTAIAKDGARGHGLGLVSDDGPPRAVELKLVRGEATLRGRVRFADGAPHRGEVQLLHPGGGEILAAPGAMPDEEGRFRFENLAPGRYGLTTLVDGPRRVIGGPYEVPHEGEVELIVDAGLRWLEGVVVAAVDEEAIAGATLIVTGRSADGTRSLARATTAGDGTFRLPRPEEDVDVHVQALGFASRSLSEEDLGSPLVIRLGLLAGIRGQVLSDRDGSPVSGVTVRLLGRPLRTEAVSDEEGRYAVADIEPGEVEIGAWGAGWVLKDHLQTDRVGRSPIEVRAGETASRDLVVTRAGAARGKVVDSTGSPVPGASVGARLARDGDPLRNVPSGLRSPSLVQASADGTFAFDTLLPGKRYRFVARQGSGPIGVTEPLGVVAGETLEVEIRLPEPRPFEVRVVERGTTVPVPDARVTVSQLHGEDSTHLGEWRTGPDGVARIGEIAPGRLRIWVECETHARLRENVLVEDQAATSARVELEQGRVLSGEILLPDGTRAEGAHLRIYRVEDHGSLGGLSCPEGTFRVERMPPVSLLVMGGLRRGDVVYRVEQEVVAREGVVLRLERHERKRPEEFRLRVLGPDGKPVPAAWVLLRRKGSRSSGHVQEELENGELRKRFPTRGDERRWIEVFGARDGEGKPLPFGAVLRGPLPDDARELELRLPPERAIAGVVRNEAGEGVAGVELGFHPVFEEPGPSSPAHETVRTDEEGRFRAGGLADVPHVIRARVPSTYSAPRETPAMAGATGVTIVLRTSRRVRVEVLQEDGKPVAGATVVAMPRGDDVSMRDRRPTATTDAEGVAWLTGLDPDRRYALSVEPPAGRQDLFRAQAREIESDRATVRLEQGFMIRGVVRNGAGEPFPEARVSCRPERGTRKLVQADAEGRFVVGPLRRGEVAFRAWDPDAALARERVPETVVDASVGEVTLVADSGLEVIVKVPRVGPHESLYGTVVFEGTGKTVRRHSFGGRIRIAGLTENDRITLFIGPLGDGHCLLRRGLVPGAGEIEAEFVPGKTITGRVLAPEGATKTGAFAMVFGNRINARAGEDGRLVIRGLPDGTWPVYGWAETPDGKRQRSIEVAAGATFELDLRNE